MPIQQTLPSSRFFLLLAVLFATLWFGQLDYRKLVKPDEGRYAEISREMVVSGDWVTPRLNDLKYFEKPPMQYWATAAAFETFGTNEWTARLWTALTGFAGVLLAGYTGARLYGRTAGLLAAIVLGSSFYYFALGHINTLDMGVSLFLELALAGFLLAHRDNAGSRENRNWMLLTWAAMAGAMLSKGLIGLVLPGAALVIYVLLTRQWQILARMHWIKGLALFGLLAVPWFVLVSQRNPEFFQFFFIHEHFQRFAADGHRRTGAWWYFFPVLIIGISPWLNWLLQSMRDGLRSQGETFRPGLLLLVWSVFIFFFFSISHSKLPAYILPIMPALAILIGKRLATTDARQLAPHFAGLAVLSAGIMIAALLLPQLQDLSSKDTPPEMILAYARWIQVACVTGCAGFVLAWLQSRRGKAFGAIVTAAAASSLVVTLFLCGHNSLARSNSAYYLAEAIKHEVRADIPFYSVLMYDQTLPFYMQRPMTLVAYTDELEMGIKAEPHKAIMNLETFRQRWQSEPKALALLRREDFEVFARDGFIPMRVIARDSRRVVVAKP